ncbi:ATP-dependent endonuclease [Micromonospora halophytica]|uniref:OLD protein-like TOPRIM domain-containing protein n=1 Tax=Micromonospora halophytica TaxID=47864 RepID=A0A1C5HY48_9ACTN|nr:ATP-dependent endonuclease [Micromonospora halophytica]SCG50935.1 hypothetical protein GA0070560_106248 [Micromonospora halophytica]
MDLRTGLAEAARTPARAVVLVEGVSDQVAIEVLAERTGRHLDGVRVVPMGGVTNIGHFLELFGPHGLDVRMSGLCDAGEAFHVRRNLARAGLGTELAAAGFSVCVVDLEEELIRAHGTVGVLELVEAHGELASFRRFQRQPAQRLRPTDAQLRRFIGTRSGRKIEYARLLTGSLDADRVPRPLAELLDRL